MLIAIEGYHGVGKSTIAKALAKKIGFLYINRPLQYSFKSNGLNHYNSLRLKVKSYNDLSKSCEFYKTNYLFLKTEFKSDNVVCDRYILSNYAMIHNDELEPYFKEMLEEVGQADFAFLLKCDPETIKNRVLRRNCNDNDLNKIHYYQKTMDNADYLIKKYKLNYNIIDTTHKSIEQILDEIVNIINLKGETR